MLIVFGFRYIIFSRRYNGPSNNFLVGIRVMLFYPDSHPAKVASNVFLQTACVLEQGQQT